VLSIFVSHHSSHFLQVIRLIDFMILLAAGLCAGSLVSCHNFLSFRLHFNSQSRQGRLFFISESITLLVDNLYAEATEAVNTRATVLISILDGINSEARL
jgi:hypothetical protein